MTRLESEWDWETLQPLLFLRIRFGVGEAAGDSAAEGETALSTGGLPRSFFPCGVLMVKGIQLVSQSVTAIELAQRQW